MWRQLAWHLLRYLFSLALPCLFLLCWFCLLSLLLTG
ncbi:putative peptidoglycan bound protein [Listeria monocytogenes]|nr:putative peptidoglycan bound protein [Listeria monocytogenes]